MNILLKFCIALSLVSSAFAVTNYKGHDFTINQSFDDTQVELSYLEKKIAGNFHKLFKLSNAGVVNKRLLQVLLTDLKKSNTFYSYIIWPQTLLKIDSANSISSLDAICSTIAERESQSATVEYLNKSTEEICYKKFLKTMSENFNKNSKVKNLFAKHLEKFLAHSMKTELKYFLSRFNKDSDAHKNFSTILTNHFEKNKIVPNTEIFPYLLITSKFTRYIQGIDLDKESNQKVFLSEYKKMARESLGKADKNANKKVISSETTKIINFINATIDKQDKDKLFKSLMSYGKSLTRRKYYESAREVFKRILQDISSETNNAIYEYLWTYIINKDYSEGLEEIKKYTAGKNLENDSKISFWIAYSKYYSGNKYEAKKIFKRLVTHNPLSYYAILSAKLMSENKDDKDTKSVYLSYLKANDKREPADIKNFDHRWLKRILAWGEVYNPTLLNLELHDISNRKSGGQLETHLLSAAYKLSQDKNYLESFKIIYRHVDRGLLGVNTEVLKLLFPLPYLEEVINKSKSFDPIIAMSLIRQESGFNRYAKSRVGARGLMQLMPGTARRFKRRVRTKQLYNSNLNIAIGTKYFQKLLTMYDNNLVYSLAAYNAGEGRISDWKERDYVNSDDSMLRNIENIPFLETRKYVKLIFRNIFFYKMLTEEPIKKDTFKFNKIYDIHVGFNR